MKCPECQEGRLHFRSADYIETHGLDCGPYEHWCNEWFECSECGARFDPIELAACNEPRNLTGSHRPMHNAEHF